MITRRSFLKSCSFSAGLYLFQPFVSGADQTSTVLRFGLIADVHQDIMHDAPQRIGAFARAMNEAKPDFVCQLGDFCQPHPRNKAFLAQWRQFNGPRTHVLGNHDMDGGFTREQTVAFLGMPHRYYSFDKNSVHIVVLDGNDPGGKSEGYKRFIADEQLDWLRTDLAATSLPTILFSHQTLDDATGIENSETVRKVLEQAKTDTGRNKVVACFCGHHHDDQAKLINGIHYIRINSASYLWLGSRLKHESYPPEIHEKYPWISYTAPYKAPLWAFVELDTGRGRLVVKGRETDWVGPTPWALDPNSDSFDPQTIGPRISDRKISF